MNLKAIDTHAHLSMAEFNADRPKLIENLEREGIGVIEIPFRADMFDRIEKLTGYPYIWGGLGVHPLEIEDHPIEQLPNLIDDMKKRISRNNKLVCIGEVGLDYKYGMKDAAKQHALLREQLNLVKEIDFPVSIHCRDAYGDLSIFLEEFKPLKGVVHCYSDGLEMAEKFMEMGLHISFTANITYPPNDDLREVAKGIPVERLLLETDSPFLPGQSKRGQRNDPGTVFEIADILASIHDVPTDEIIDQTTKNAISLFNLKI